VSAMHHVSGEILEVAVEDGWISEISKGVSLIS